jgi:hypothetical protein
LNVPDFGINVLLESWVSASNVCEQSAIVSVNVNQVRGSDNDLVVGPNEVSLVLLT